MLLMLLMLLLMLLMLLMTLVTPPKLLVTPLRPLATLLTRPLTKLALQQNANYSRRRPSVR